ncbi:hypothetical protein VTL71DRAFT_2997 [Oculimacula yallundae]|uniref:Zn(2)-C6 fungal-type domain-containing protein n=1 Tax=Oculimacula yallundae TaxID=86028 RepID=A0ABR4C5W4_9HELO
MSKSGKSVNRSSKRSTPPHDHVSGVLDGRHKRVWKACERCRMKKTKCDGESPCKRCKDDGLVCTAGSRKKTEYKQIPRGYAEVLENTQFALNATVQKLYSMVRNNEPWTLGEPELNGRGQPVIHDIASKLGCIRASPDLPYAIPEGEEGLAYLKAQLQSPGSEMIVEDNSGRKHSEDSSSDFSGLQRTERASSSESDGSNESKSYSDRLWTQQQQQSVTKLAPRKAAPLNMSQVPSFEEEVAHRSQVSLDTTSAMSSPMYSNYQADLYGNSPFAAWAGTDEFLGQAHALDLTAQFMIQQAQNPRSAPFTRQNGFNTGTTKEDQMMNDLADPAIDTISPLLLSGYWNSGDDYCFNQN